MPSKIRPNDWDRLFAPNARRRGGPLQAFINLVIVCVVLGAFGVGASYIRAQQRQRFESAVATATAFAVNVAPQLTATAQGATAETGQAEATRVAARTATVEARGTAQSVGIGVGVVASGGNLRSEPRVAADTVVGLIWPGDQIAFLERRDVGAQAWFRIRVVQAAPSRGGKGVDPGTEGWASATLLSQPTPVPTS